MHLDVVDLRKFYYTTDLGRRTQRSLRDAVRRLWPDTHGMTVVGFGFAAPLLRPFLDDSARTICLMPSQQGVCPWPAEGPNVSALVEETLWPLATGSADRIVIAHGLETCERPHALIAEIARVLAPAGRALFIAPNRAGLWARRDATPFGYGRPYSTGQLERALTAHHLAIERECAALYHLPSHRRFWLRFAPAIERLGQRLDWQRLAGVSMVEVTKLVFVPPQSGAREAVTSPIRVLEGLTPAPKPAASRVPVRG